jgi:hypothetical protein
MNGITSSAFGLLWREFRKLRGAVSNRRRRVLRLIVGLSRAAEKRRRSRP